MLTMENMEKDETVLIQKATAGDAAAFGALYEHYVDAIYRYIYLRMGNEDNAQDVTENVFLKAWEALPGYEFQGYPFSSWLYRIAHNAVIDHKRQDGHVVPTPLDCESWESDQPAALESIIKAEEAETLATAVAQLSDDQQQVVILRFVEGMNHTDVANIIDKSPGACRVLQHRALKKLEQLLSESEEIL